MRIKAKVTSDGVVIKFSGFFDHTMEAIYRATVERVYEENRPHVIFDFTYLTDLNHVGLGLLLMTLSGLHSRNTLCSLVNPNARILLGLEQTYLTSVVHVCSSEREAWAQG